MLLYAEKHVKSCFFITHVINTLSNGLERELSKRCNYDALKYVFNSTYSPRSSSTRVAKPSATSFSHRACHSMRRISQIRRPCAPTRTLNRHRFPLGKSVYTDMYRHTPRDARAPTDRRRLLSLSLLLPLHVGAIFREQTSRLWKPLTRYLTSDARSGRLDP